MMGRSPHLHDDQLYECYLADLSGETIDPRAAGHLADCPDCAARYDDVSGCFTAIRTEGEAEADAVFTRTRLQTQQDSILRRLAQAGRPARVIAFPGRVTRHIASASTRLSLRWLAAASAAGLFVGVALGGAFSAQPVSGRNFKNGAASSRAGAGVSNRLTPPPAARIGAPFEVIDTVEVIGAVEAVDDDRFLLELEMALERPHTRELIPFDNLTPHLRDIDSRLR